MEKRTTKGEASGKPKLTLERRQKKRGKVESRKNIQGGQGIPHIGRRPALGH